MKIQMTAVFEVMDEDSIPVLISELHTNFDRDSIHGVLEKADGDRVTWRTQRNQD